MISLYTCDFTKQNEWLGDTDEEINDHPSPIGDSVFVRDTKGQHDGRLDVPQIVKTVMGQSIFFTELTEPLI